MSELAKYPLIQSKIIKVSEDRLGNYVELVIHGVEKNSGIPIANLIRRIAHSYTIGTSIVGVKIKGISCEFDSIPGILEDTNNIIYNIKNIIVQSNFQNIGKTSKLLLKANRVGSLYASDVKCPSGIKILNPEIKLCTISEPVSFEMVLFIKSGVGYYQGDTLEKGLIPINGSFSPLEHFSYEVKSFPQYEDIMIHIRTNGTIEPIEVFYHAIELLSTKFQQMLYSKD